MSMGDLPGAGFQAGELNRGNSVRGGTGRDETTRSASLLDRFFSLLPRVTFNTADQATEFTNIPFQASAEEYQLALGNNLNRTYLLIQNKSVTDSIFVVFGVTSAGSTRGAVEIVAGGNYEPLIGPVSEVYIYWDGTTAGDGNVGIVEGVGSSRSRKR